MERKEVNFQSWGEWVDYCKLPVSRSAKSRKSIDGTNDFNAEASYKTAIEFSEFGWPDGIKQIMPLRNALMTKLANLVPVAFPFMSVTGRDFDIGAVIDGEPEQWVDYNDEISDSFKAVTIVVNGAYSCGVSTEVVLARGACVAALVDLLELTNVRCTVILDMGFADYPNKDALITARVVVKTFDQPLDLNRLAFALAHAASFRRMGFRLLENNPEYHQEVGTGCYGYPGEVPKDRRGNVYIEQMQWSDKNTWQDIDFAKQWVTDQLKAQGIDILKG